jgi:alkyldihydroxyacetonephosphate synthase
MSDVTAPRMRWWGWGVDGHDRPLPAAAEAMLRDELGLGDEPRADPVPLEEVALPEAALPAAARERLAAIVGNDYLRDERLSRVTHTAGRSYPDLISLRSGPLGAAPDAVVYPGSPGEVAELLAACAEQDVAVIPYGGGTSVSGGVEPLRGGHAAAVSVDLARLDRLLGVDRLSELATFGAGATGPQAEAKLGAHGLTLGHFPQSFEFCTIGGWLATPSAGQASTGYGRIDELVVGLRFAAPSGEIATRLVPATAAGPDLRELLVGSEGVLGIITEATLRVRPRPTERRYEGWSFKSFAEGAEAFRELEQAGRAPDVARLSDKEETRLMLSLAPEGAAKRLADAYLKARSHGGVCLMVCGFEGDAAGVRSRRRAAASTLRDAGGVALGTRPGAAWERGRFQDPYLRDELLSRRVLVDTLETATTWANLDAIYRAVGDALRRSLAARGTPALVMCHLSHLYPTGASLYYTLLARQERGAELEQWHAAKVAAGDAITAHGGTITHHHAVGRDHAPWLEPEVGPVWIDLLRAAKRQLDPQGIMNPGKLIDAEPLPGAPA